MRQGSGTKEAGSVYSLAKRNRRYLIMWSAILYGGLLCLMVFSLLQGRFDLHLKDLWEIFASALGFDAQPNAAFSRIIWDVRVPRVVLASLIGGALAVSGASYQTLFKNPLVSPGILGVSAGAACGAALGMVMNADWWEIQFLSLVFGLLAVLGANMIAWIFGKRELTVLILGGVVISSLFGALLSVIKMAADTENQLPSIVFWMMGSLARGQNRDIFVMLPALFISLVLLWYYRHEINALAAGEEEAKSLGVRVGLVKTIVICCATTLTAVAVSIAGIVGWVGMVVPHMARILTGASFPKLLILSFGLGGVFLLGIDTISRSYEGLDLPLGVMTSLVGTPLFIFFLSKVRRGW